MILSMSYSWQFWIHLNPITSHLETFGIQSTSTQSNSNQLKRKRRKNFISVCQTVCLHQLVHIMILLDETSTQLFEFGCYLGGHINDANDSVVMKKHYNLGPLVSVIICYNLIRMGNLNLLNKSFLVFFTIDSILGITETFLMFDLNNTRYKQ